MRSMFCFGVPLEDFGDDLTRRGRFGGQGQADLGHRLGEIGERRPDPGIDLVEVRRHVCQGLALGRLFGKAEGHPRRVDRLQGLL